MICFHFTIFVVLETTFDLLTADSMLVVICFHFTIFVVLETTGLGGGKSGGSCDLLSFYYLCRTGNNSIEQFTDGGVVVICFHFTIFVVLETTSDEFYIRGNKL